MENNQETNVNVNQEETNTEVDHTTDDTKKGKTFSQDEVNAILEKRLAKERAKMEQLIKSEISEAQRLETLSENEREKALFEKELNSFKEEKSKFEREKLLLETNKQLISKNLPTDFAEHLISNDAKTTLENINNFEKVWQDAINKEVSQKIKGTSPTKPVQETNQITKESFRKMSLLEQSRLAQENPKLYEDLILKN